MLSLWYTWDSVNKFSLSSRLDSDKNRARVDPRVPSPSGISIPARSESLFVFSGQNLAIFKSVVFVGRVVQPAVDSMPRTSVLAPPAVAYLPPPHFCRMQVT